MNNKYIFKFKLHFTYLILVAVIVCLPAGCSNPFTASSDTFSRMEVNNKIAHFSFEFRNYYSDKDGPYVVDDQYSRFTSMTVLASKKSMEMPDPDPGSDKTVNMQYTPASIHFLVGNAVRNPMNAVDRIDNIIRSCSRWENFELLERKSIEISVTKAEMVIYQVDGFWGPKLLYRSDIAFDYGGKEWDIRLESDIALADVAKGDLEHVIRTFRVLD